MFNAQQRDVIYVLSNCPESQNLIRFDLEDPRNPKFAGSRWLSSDATTTSKKVCVLPSELIIFDNVDNGHTLTSYDRGFSFTKSVIDNKVYGLTKHYDFSCIPELDVFITLNDDSQGQVEESPKEIVVYRGGTSMQGMKRVLFRIHGLNSQIQQIITYAH